MFKLIGKKYLQFYSQTFCLSKPMLIPYTYSMTPIAEKQRIFTFLKVNTKYVSWIVLKTSCAARVKIMMF